jgi:hypothetical protein
LEISTLYNIFYIIISAYYKEKHYRDQAGRPNGIKSRLIINPGTQTEKEYFTFSFPPLHDISNIVACCGYSISRISHADFQSIDAQQTGERSAGSVFSKIHPLTLTKENTHV